MSASVRIGLKRGLALPARSNLATFDHIIEIATSEGTSIGRLLDGSSIDLREVVGCFGVASGCVQSTTRSLILTGELNSIDMRFIDIDTCRHVTRVVLVPGFHVENWSNAPRRLSLNDLASLAVQCAGNPHVVTGQIALAKVMSDELHVHLAAALKSGLPALPTLTNPSSEDEGLTALAVRRNALGEIEEYALSAQVCQADLALLRSEIDRADSVLHSLTAIQIYRLAASNTELASLTRQVESAHAERERRWARLGAATIFPLLLVSLLGANTFPTSINGISTRSLSGFLVTLVAAALLSIIGYIWATHPWVRKTK